MKEIFSILAILLLKTLVRADLLPDDVICHSNFLEQGESKKSGPNSLIYDGHFQALLTFESKTLINDRLLITPVYLKWPLEK